MINMSEEYGVFLKMNNFICDKSHFCINQKYEPLLIDTGIIRQYSNEFKRFYFGPRLKSDCRSNLSYNISIFGHFKGKIICCCWRGCHFFS